MVSRRRAQPRRLRREEEDILKLFAWSFHYYRYLCVEREQQTVVESADCNEHRALFPERVMMLFSFGLLDIFTIFAMKETNGCRIQPKLLPMSIVPREGNNALFYLDRRSPEASPGRGRQLRVLYKTEG